MSLLDIAKKAIKIAVPASNMFNSGIKIVETIKGADTGSDQHDLYKLSSGQEVHKRALANVPEADVAVDAIAAHLFASYDIPYVKGKNETDLETGLYLVAKGIFNQTKEDLLEWFEGTTGLDVTPPLPSPDAAAPVEAVDPVVDHPTEPAY